MNITTKILKATANERRVRILQMLLEREKLVVNKICKELKISYPLTSKHLAKLESVGLVKKRQENLWVYYSINQDKKKKYNQVFLKFIKMSLSNLPK